MVPEGSALAVQAPVLGDVLVSSCGVAELPSAGMPMGSNQAWHPWPSWEQRSPEATEGCGDRLWPGPAYRAGCSLFCPHSFSFYFCLS